MTLAQPLETRVRAAVAAVLAHALLLHTILMGVGLAPSRVDLHPDLAALYTICSPSGGGMSQLPEHPTRDPQHAPCALCGLGHCGMAPPPSALVALPARPAQAAPITPLVRTASLVPTRYPVAARPRGPPASA